MNAQASKQDSLLAAVKANNFEKAKKLINDYGLILDDEYSDYKLLVQALLLGHKDIAKLLLDNGCRVFCHQKNNQQTTIFSTPLHYAVNLNCKDLVKILLDKGASIRAKDANKKTPLNYAINHKYFKIVDLMLSYYKIKYTNINNEDEVSHFHIAVMRNNTKLVKSFLEHGMQVNRTSQYKSSMYTPLHFAVENKSIETVQLLLSNKANFGLKNAQGQSPLHLAFYLENCKENDKIIDLILLAHLKVMVNPIDTNGVSHFHIACSKSNIALLKSFLKSGVDCNSCIFSKSSMLPGYTPLHIAIKYNRIETVKFLIDHKADINKATDLGVTPLHEAVGNAYGNIKIVKLLIKHNADVCAMDIDRNTAIHKEFETMQINELSQSTKAIINLLLSAHKGNLNNVSNNWNLSLFHIACATANDPWIIENFLKQNVNINACVKKNVPWAGYSALYFAVIAGNLKVIQRLLQHNVALIMVNFDKHSTLYWVCKLWIEDTIKAIESSTAKSPTKTLNDEDFRVDILTRLRSIDENRNEIFKLFLKRNEMYDFMMFDVYEMILKHCQREAINPQSEMFQLKINQLVLIFKTIAINLIDHGYNINKKNSKKLSILRCLIDLLRNCYSISMIEMFELLLIRGAHVDITEGPNDVTPLMIAAKEGFVEIVDILLKYKANPNKCSKIHATPLHFALYCNTLKLDTVNSSLKIVNLLLAKEAKVDAKDSKNCTPLHYAAAYMNVYKSLLSLLQHNCKVDSKNSVGDTALHIACFNRNLPGLISLLNYGADINLVNNRNWTPLELLIEPSPEVLIFGNLENCQMLKILELHIIKLNFIGFKVSKRNNCAFKRIKKSCMELEEIIMNVQRTEEDSVICDDNNIFIDLCARELTRMKNVNIDMYTSLYSIIFKNVHEVSKTVNNENFKKLLNSNELKEYFPLYGYILCLQYKKGLKRYELLKPAEDILKTALDLPDLCYERILACFTNQELKRLCDQTKSQ